MRFTTLKLRLKIALWAFMSDEMLNVFHYVLRDDDFTKSYFQNLKSLMNELGPRGRKTLQEALKLKAVYRIRKGAGNLDFDKKKVINNSRLLEIVSFDKYITLIDKEIEKEREMQSKENK